RANQGAGSPNRVPSTSRARTMAVRTRCLSKLGLRRAALGELFRAEAEAALPFVVLGNGAVKSALIKVRPVDGGEVQLGVGHLPEQEIADALLPGGADTQVRGRSIRQGQLAAEHLFIDILGPQRPRLNLECQL